jgi:hypothetical protein
MALLLTSVFGVTGCGSDDDEAPVESRIKNSTIDDIGGDSVGLGGDSVDIIEDRLDSLDLFDSDDSDDDYGSDDVVDLKDVDELMFEPKSGDTIYDSPYDDFLDDDIKDEIKINLDLKDDTLKSLLDTGHHVGVDKSETGDTYIDDDKRSPAIIGPDLDVDGG